ncbi:hypothetical protein PsorP6_017723 [Peronosclerospora sorghi]|uniref:Uncharacterized protein n=1 Tax=Peronosclerospora sorghi TaxID=230839 RepID=A0ACC0WNP4_9STRA|nr:hypothetical protein PsorP6_017723 [Peronosclerospora sorghi]
MAKGYELLTLDKTTDGWRGTLALQHESHGHFGNDLALLELDVVRLSTNQVRIHNTDPAFPRYKVPDMPVRRQEKNADEEEDFQVHFTPRPFGVAVSRRHSGEVLFNSTTPVEKDEDGAIFSGLIFENQFIEISTQLTCNDDDNPILYGLGERLGIAHLPHTEHIPAMKKRRFLVFIASACCTTVSVRAALPSADAAALSPAQNNRVDGTEKQKLRINEEVADVSDDERGNFPELPFAILLSEKGKGIEVPRAATQEIVPHELDMSRIWEHPAVAHVSEVLKVDFDIGNIERSWNQLREHLAHPVVNANARIMMALGDEYFRKLVVQDPKTDFYQPISLKKLRSDNEGRVKNILESNRIKPDRAILRMRWLSGRIKVDQLKSASFAFMVIGSEFLGKIRLVEACSKLNLEPTRVKYLMRQIRTSPGNGHKSEDEVFEKAIKKAMGENLSLKPSADSN